MATNESAESGAKRRYRKGRRAEQESATHRRILDAALELIAEVGPDGITVSAVARRAGVQRLTVYRHFPDDSLLDACASRQTERHPLPDPADWASIDDPERRLRRALRALYDYYRGGNDYLAALDRAPAASVITDDYTENVIATLVAGWKPRGKHAHDLEATLQHVLRFDTWRSLTAGSGLDDRGAARLAARWVRASGRKAR